MISYCITGTKNRDAMNDLNEYFNEVLGYDLHVIPATNAEMNRLPLIIRNKYGILIGSFFERKIALLQAKNNHYTKVNELRKHIDIVKGVFNIPVVYVCETMKGYNRKRFIQRGISFIVPGKQMFMPELLVNLQDFALRPGKIPEAMTPLTQYLLLYHLQVAKLEGMNFKNIAQTLKLGTMTITRAANYLASKRICEVVGTKDKQLHFDKEGYELWNIVEPLMQNPLKKKVFATPLIHVENSVYSGINALAHYTDIAYDNKPYYALDKKAYDSLLKENKQLFIDEVDGETVIEIWKYNPKGLAIEEFVDPLSLYLIYRNDTDERVQIVINQLIDEMKW